MLSRASVDAIANAELCAFRGELVASAGSVLEARGPDVSIGELCLIRDEHGGRDIEAEVVGFREGRVLLMSYGDTHGLSAGARIVAMGGRRDVPVGEAMLGRVLDAFGKPLDEGPPLHYETRNPVFREPLNPMHREPISEVLETRVRAIDGLLAMGLGQRVGVFAGSGVGKSTLLGMLATQAQTDISVIALIGERGREVGDFVTQVLGEEGLRRAVVIAATADQPPLVRVHAVHAAHAVAEYFRDKGKNVMLILDSMTRYAMAQREIGLAAGEPPTSRGYPPSVFNRLPAIVERCGNVREKGSISAIYSVLVEGDDMNEPVADHMRAILDGHIVLSRQWADRGRLPAIDPLRSVSRLMNQLVDRSAREVARKTRLLLSKFEEARDLIAMGAYKEGHDAELDHAVKISPALERFLSQEPGDSTPRDEAMQQLADLVLNEESAA
ncbi:FliI/YscN family ATPase [Oleiagrimonas citrea]|uniref:protein-secreting ATPase n=2 Tax=Oleiagrimonas citrea TaxID=1665687 RepID=A0A846ZL28_9GAMM|nr:FliI/YscN family ATPase [Oleiagrimonas citrea]